MNHLLKSRLTILEETIPTANGRRTNRGRLRTCRQLGEHISRARQLLDLAKNESERAAVEEFVQSLEKRRADLAAEGALAKAARDDRAIRRLRRALQFLAPTNASASIGQDPPTDDA